MSQKLLDEDVQLMLCVKDNDRNAFDRLIDKYQTPLINFIYRLVRDKGEAEDLAQETFLRVYRSAATYMPRAKFSTWLYKIAKNLTLNELRRRSSHKTSSIAQIDPDGERMDIDPADESSSPLEKAAYEEMARIVADAIETLPKNQRIAVILSKYEGLSYEEINTRLLEIRDTSHLITKMGCVPIKKISDIRMFEKIDFLEEFDIIRNMGALEDFEVINTMTAA